MLSYKCINFDTIYRYPERADTLNNGRHAHSNQRRIRYDRIIIAVVFTAVLLTVFFLISNTAKSNKRDDKTDGLDSSKVSDSVIKSTGRIEFEKVFYDHDEINKGHLILVNSTHEYLSPSDEISLLENIDKNKNDFYLLKNIDMTLNKDVIKAFNNMMSGYYSELSSKSLMVTNAFVTAQSQNIMFNQALTNSRNIPKGGFSEHQTGLAIDIDIYSQDKNKSDETTETAINWLKENCDKYGFIFRYPDEKSDITGISDHTKHLRYIGIPHAYYITSNNLTLEEYIEELKKYTYGHKSLNFSCFSKEYEIYYIKAKEGIDDVDVYVPTTNPYTISGNNIDGFIVTVEK